MVQRAAMGQRGDYTTTTPHGDLCSRRAAARADVRDGYDRAIKATKDALQNEPIEIVSLNGGRSYALPRELLNFIRAEAMAEAD